MKIYCQNCKATFTTRYVQCPICYEVKNVHVVPDEFLEKSVTKDKKDKKERE